MLSSFHSLVLYLGRRRSVLHAAFHGSGPCILPPPLYAPASSLLPSNFPAPALITHPTIFQSSLRTSRAMDASTLSSFFSSQYTLFPSYTQLCSDLAFAYAYAWRATTGTWVLLPCIWRIGAFDFLIHGRALRA